MDYNYDTSVYDSAAGSSEAAAAAAAAAIGISLVALVIGYVVSSIFLGMIFKKAGVEPWKAWVPFYNYWVFFELGGQKGWLSLLVLLSWIPVLGFVGAIVAAVFACIAAYRIGLNFGKEAWFVVLFIFVPLVWLIWLAVDNSTWKPVKADKAVHDTTPPNQPAAM